MIVLISIVVIFLLSLVLALWSVEKELSVPVEVKNLKISSRKTLSGVILFLKEKIIHYSSKSK